MNEPAGTPTCSNCRLPLAAVATLGLPINVLKWNAAVDATLLAT